MTFREKLKQQSPNLVGEGFCGGCYGCPWRHGFENGRPSFCRPGDEALCMTCWGREIPGTEPSAKWSQGAGALRPCEVDGQRCYFHRFVEEEQGLLQFNENVILGGTPMEWIVKDFEEHGIIANCCSLEKLRHAYALVEFPDGTVKKVEPEKVRFLDREG